MIYVMEFGPLRVAGSKGKQWVVFSVDLAPKGFSVLFTHMAPDQATARRAMSVQLGVQEARKVQCCESLGRFGQGRGWQVARAPLSVWRHAAVIHASLKLRDELGECAFTPELEELLRSSALFLLAKPWERPLAQSCHPLESGEIVGLFGANGVPGIAIVPSREAFERAQSRDPRLSALPDAVLVSVVPDDRDEFTKNAFGLGFSLGALRRRAGRAVQLSFDDAQLAAAVLREFAMGQVPAREASHGP
ncbi:MAG: hypothetical protein JNM17_14265 [Archangium sp.]|nr:hypothetical protein [Archangium sp.]